MAVFRARGDEIPKGSRYLSEKSSFFLFFLSGPGAIQGETNRPSIGSTDIQSSILCAKHFTSTVLGLRGVQSTNVCGIHLLVQRRADVKPTS